MNREEIIRRARLSCQVCKAHYEVQDRPKQRVPGPLWRLVLLRLL